VENTNLGAVETETLSRNVASVISPPPVEAEEVEILTAAEIAVVLDKLAGHHLFAIAAVDLATGLRRGELLALPWSNVDLDAATLRVERSLEETKAGLRFKPPKTAHGRRTISLPPSTVTALREHRRKQLETRLASASAGRSRMRWSSANPTVRRSCPPGSAIRGGTPASASSCRASASTACGMRTHPR
jgi:integrase